MNHFSNDNFYGRCLLTGLYLKKISAEKLRVGHWEISNTTAQYRKKTWQIPKYRVENRRNTDTEVARAGGND